MFGLSQVRSVRRTDLESCSSSEERGSPDPTLETRFRAQLQQSYAEEHQQVALGHGDRPPERNLSPTVGTPRHEDEAAYEFRLFAGSSGGGPSKSQGNGLQRITLRSPTPLNGEPGFVRPQRPEGYYFSGAKSAEQAERFSAAAVSGEQVLEGLKTRWRGLELPWRVTIIKVKRPIQVAGPEGLTQDSSAKRRRIGKKRRIILRKRIEAKSIMKTLALQSQAEKDAAEKDKRTKRNREKKVKKRLKEKLKKSSGAHDDGRMADSD